MMMEVNGSDQKAHLNSADIKAAYEKYIQERTNFKPKQVAEVLGIIILLFGLFIEALLIFNYKPSSCAAVEVPSFFECGSDGLILIVCIILSIPLFLITTIGKSNYKIPAGWLIEKCGFKDIKQKKVSVYEKQALVIINLGDAKGIDIYAFSQKIKETVREKFDILLEEEVNII